jgi:hypothetical protein
MIVVCSPKRLGAVMSNISVTGSGFLISRGAADKTMQTAKAALADVYDI